MNLFEENDFDQASQTLQQLINSSSRIVFLGGAGVSTESGIPDFRSVDGLYNQKWAFPPEEILSATFFHLHTNEFYRFYRAKLICHGIQPNAGHKKLAELENSGKLTACITTNIDGLHQLAGSKNVLELHGTVLKNHCTKCNKFFDLNYVEEHQDKEFIPLCDECGGIIKPDVVLYEEGLDNSTLNQSIKSISEADLLIVAGTSLTVYPAAGLIQYASKNCKRVLINRDATQSDNFFEYVMHTSIGKLLDSIKL